MFSGIQLSTVPRGFGLVTLAGVLWGTVGVAIQTLYSFSEATPVSLSFFRLGIATPLLFLACWRMLGGRMFQIQGRHLLLMMLSGSLVAVSHLAYFAAIPYAGIATATLIAICAAPVLVTLIARERLGQRGIIALVCAVIGVILLTGFQPDSDAKGQAWIGILLAFGAAASYAGVVLCGRFLTGRYHPLQINSIGFGTGALLLLIAALASNSLVITYPLQGWLLLLYLGAVPTALGYGLFLAGMRTVSAPVASILTLMEPLTATLLAWVIFNEQLGLLGILGAVLLAGALALLSTDGRVKQEVALN
jgi:drug/metabolite transporter, DME family